MGSRPRLRVLVWIPLGVVLAASLAHAQEESLQEALEKASQARYRSPSESRALDAALRERLKVEPNPTVEAGTWLNDCRSLIEDDGKRASEAADTGLAVLNDAHLEAAPVRALLEVCQYQAREYLGELADALPGYDRIVALAIKLDNKQVEAEARLTRGESRAYVGRFADGLEDLKIARAIYLDLQRESDALTALQAIGTLYYRVHDYDRAIEYFNEVVPEREKRGQTYMLGDAYYNLARAQEGRSDFEAALGNFERMRTIAQQIGSTTWIAYAQQSIGALRVRRGEVAIGLSLFDQSLPEFRKIEDRDMVARVQQARGSALQKLGRMDEAIAAVAESVRLYQEIDNKPGLERVYALQAELLLSQSDFKGAVAVLQLERAVHLDLDESRRDESLAQMRAQFDAEKKEQQNRVLEAQQKLAASALESAQRQQQLQTLVIALTVALLSLAGAFLARQLRLARRLRVLALVDELTGIANRRSVLAFLEEQIRLHRASGKSLAVVLLDIDYFKRLNDTHGHAAGDEALKAVAGVCQQVMRGHDRIGRTGGEEFLCVLPEAPLTKAGEVAERLCEQVRRLDLDRIASGLRITISIGVSEWHASDPDAQAVVKRADAALYAAKSGGRDRVSVSAA